MWGGADVTSRSWSVYSGVTLAPFGDLGGDGWRVRSVAGYGAYHYDGTRSVAGKLSPETFRGTIAFADVLLGYQKRYGPLTLKVFAGIAAEEYHLNLFDAENVGGGLDLGFKGLLETWLNVTERSWASLDLAWSSAHETYASRVRFGFRLSPALSLGLEGAAAGNAEYDGGRAGALARYTWEGGEIWASAGPSLDGSMTTGAYGTLNVLIRF
jgi:Cellulose biosynthesis protein BcsS